MSLFWHVTIISLRVSSMELSEDEKGLVLVKVGTVL